MVKKLVETKKVKNLDKAPKKLVIASDLLAEDLKKGAKKSSGLSGLHKKLFKGSSGSAKRGDESSKKALTEVTSNTRTLAMVLRSERELLNLNKEQEDKIADLNILLQDKNREVCLTVMLFIHYCWNSHRIYYFDDFKAAGYVVLAIRTIEYRDDV